MIFSSVRDNISLLPLLISSIKEKYTEKAQNSIKNANNILFVCMGNICRSPFAQYYAQTILPKTVKILSCGYDTYDDRSSPHEAIAAAKKFGIDLTNHRSKVINKNLIENAQAIFVFDEKTRHIVLSCFPFSKKKVHRLGLLVGKKQPIIADPYGGNLKTFIETYQDIIKALNYVK